MVDRTFITFHMAGFIVCCAGGSGAAELHADLSVAATLVGESSALTARSLFATTTRASLQLGTRSQHAAS
jgi:hypothetical protein